jgi:hypothetical protein
MSPALAFNCIIAVHDGPSGASWQAAAKDEPGFRIWDFEFRIWAAGPPNSKIRNPKRPSLNRPASTGILNIVTITSLALRLVLRPFLGLAVSRF